MWLIRHITALVLLLSLFATVCQACVPTLVADTCCEEPCHACACYDAQAAEQPLAVAPVVSEQRTEAADVMMGFPSIAVSARPDSSWVPVPGRVAPSSPPSLSMLSVYRI